jgi:hypothetical protein
MSCWMWHLTGFSGVRENGIKGSLNCLWGLQKNRAATGTALGQKEIFREVILSWAPLMRQQ